MTDPWNDLSPRVVMVASFKEGDGIGKYAEQLAAAYGEGRTFLRVGILWGPGDYHRNYHSGPRALWLLRDARRGDDVVVHWHPHYYLRGSAASRALSHLSWAALSRLRRVTFVHHEPDDTDVPWYQAAACRLQWRRARRVVFHSEWERERHVARYGRRTGQELLVVTHGDFFRTSVAVGRHEARARLGLSDERVVALMIGFLSPSFPDKGYDRVLAAVEAIGDPRLELHVVGSPIRPGEDVDALVAHLRAEAERLPGVFLHEQFVDDETFDLWIRAADAVLTPYREASSSGVVARCRLLGTRVITSDAGGLAEQAGPDDLVVRDDDELTAAIRRTVDEAYPASSSA
jgi:glycosyltransferase involved in cell wall biosynthesis